MVAAKCRRSWKRTQVSPARRRAVSQMTQKLLGRKRSPVAPVKRGASLVGSDEAPQVVFQRRQDRARQVDLARVAVLGRPEVERAVVELVERALHPHRAGHEVDVSPLEAEHLTPAQCSPGRHDNGGPILLWHGLGEYGHLVDVGDASFRQSVGAAALDPTGVLEDEIIQNGGIENGLEQAVGGAGDAGGLGGELCVPATDHDRGDLGELSLPEGRDESVGDEPAVVLLGASPDVRALRQPEFGVIAEQDATKFGVHPVAPPDRG